jgi:uncharacterized protein (DUF1330 family)
MAYGYVVAHVNVTDPVQYEHYKALSSSALAAGGGEVLARGGRVDIKEGHFHPRVVLFRFENFEAAQAWYDGPYVQARAARAGAAEMNMMLLEGI